MPKKRKFPRRKKSEEEKNYVDNALEAIVNTGFALGTIVASYILIEIKKKHRKWVFWFLYLLCDMSKKLRKEIEYTKFVGMLSDKLLIDYHKLDKCIVNFVKAFYKGLGKNYKGTYVTAKVVGFLATYLKIGYGHFPSIEDLKRIITSDETLAAKLEKIPYFVFRMPW